MLAGTSHRRLCWPRHARRSRIDAYLGRDRRRLCSPGPSTPMLRPRRSPAVCRGRRRVSRGALAPTARSQRLASAAECAVRRRGTADGLGSMWTGAVALAAGRMQWPYPRTGDPRVCDGDLGAASLLAVSAAGRAPLAGWRGLPKAGETRGCTGGGVEHLARWLVVDCGASAAGMAAAALSVACERSAVRFRPASRDVAKNLCGSLSTTPAVGAWGS
jgi:hypothetical protein